MTTPDAYLKLRQQPLQASRRQLERALCPDSERAFTVPGICLLCRRLAAFAVDFRYSYYVDGSLTPNWREHLLCPHCGLNNRMRATLQVGQQQGTWAPRQPLYCTEQLTPLYAWLKQRYPQTQGSEYAGDAWPLGTTNTQGVRNEDLTALRFPDRHFAGVICLDVLEHIPNFHAALRELYRVLRPGGTLLLSVPFLPERATTLVRAEWRAGQLLHHCEPEYHGNPLDPAGCLAFYHFGWDLRAALQGAGFGLVQLACYWSASYGHLGADQLLWLARR